MNLLIITDYAAPYKGNFIKSLENLEMLMKSDNTINYLFPTSCRSVCWMNNFQQNHSVSFFSISKIDLYNKIRGGKNGIDLIYSHFCLFSTQKVIKLFCCLHPHVKQVQHFHNHYFNVKNPIYKWCFNGDLNIGCSKSVMESLPYRNKKYVTNAIDFTRLEEWDKSYKFPDCKGKTIIVMGFDYERKGIDIIIKALWELGNTNQVNLVIVMSINREENRNRIIQDFGDVPQWIHIVNSREDIATYYNNADIFISAAREEGFCYALVEAAYCGCILVSSNIEGVPKDIPNCNFFESENDKQLNKIIINSISKNYEKTYQFVTRKYVQENYEIRKWARDVYKQLLSMV